MKDNLPVSYATITAFFGSFNWNLVPLDFIKITTNDVCGHLYDNEEITGLLWKLGARGRDPLSTKVGLRKRKLLQITFKCGFVGSERKLKLIKPDCNWYLINTTLSSIDNVWYYNYIMNGMKYADAW